MLYLAKRHLLARKKQTALILMGILLGCAVFVIFSGMMLGFQSYMIDQLINNDANIRISAHEKNIEKQSTQTVLFGENKTVNWIIAPSGRRDSQRIDNPYQWYRKLKSDPRIAAFVPQLIVQGLARNGKLSEAVTIIGTNPSQQMKVTTIGNYLTKGSFSELKSGGNRIILGDGLLTKLGARFGGNILLSSGKDHFKIFKVIGVFHIGAPQVDDTMAYVNLSDAQIVNQTPNQVSDIAVRLFDVNQAKQVAAEWRSVMREKVQSWDQTNANILAVFRTQDFIRYFTTLSILLVASFGIYNVLSVLINQKKKEIAILRAMGFGPNKIRQLFLYQGLIVGLIGGLLGLLIGYLGCRYLGSLAIFKDNTGRDIHLKISYNAAIYINALSLALVSTLVASFLPANSASKLTPIEIIRESGA